MRRSAAPSQQGVPLTSAASSSAAAPTTMTPFAGSSSKKRKKENDEESGGGGNKANLSTSTLAPSSKALEWAKLKEDCKKSRHSMHDNYDASQFRSAFRKPLANMSNAAGATASSATASSSDSSAANSSSSSSNSHVSLSFSRLLAF